MSDLQKNFKIADIPVGLNEDMFVMAGPCVIESYELCLEIANELLLLQEQLGIKFIFKSSFDKANRTSIESFRGPGIDKGLEILQAISKQTSLPVMTDIH